MKKTLTIDGIEVTFKASAAVPMIYRKRYGRDIFKDLAKLNKLSEDDMEGFNAEVFERLAYVMACHAEPKKSVPSLEEWLGQFGMFSIYEILPEIVELWGLNMEVDVESKKNNMNQRGK